MEKEIDGACSYVLPAYKVVRYDGKYIIVSQESSKWIVLNSYEEFEIYKCFSQKKTVEEIFQIFPEKEESIINVLTQIEARQFYENPFTLIENNDGCQIHLTNMCNLRCRHCYMFSGNVDRTDELSTNEIITFCEAFFAKGGRSVTLTGGEVCCRNDIGELIKKIVDIGLSIRILTNGTMWTAELIDIVKHRSNITVQVSIDGYDEESNSKIRGVGTFSKSMDFVKRIISFNIPVEIAITPLPDVLFGSEKKYADFALSLLERYGEDKIKIIFGYELLVGRELPRARIQQIKNDYYKSISAIVDSVYPEGERDGFVFDHSDGRVFNNCGYGRINIDASGNVFFCSRFSDVYRYGNIREIGVEKVFEMSKQIHELSSVDNLMPCKDCAIKYICGGGCRVNNFSQLVSCNILEQSGVFSRTVECTSKDKEFFYKLMLDTNERFF